jgi:GT2 family glycosyltransferase
MPDLSIVVATRDRPALLARCLDSLLAQETDRDFEVVVVNDGMPLSDLPQVDDPRVVLLSTAGRGPAAARNRGVAEARGSLILFTDDDAVPELGWLDAAARALEAAPDAVGAEGPIEGLGYDPLFEHAIHNELPGAYFTCNVAYRREDFLDVAGFDVHFPSPHCEDVDLGRRLARRGRILFVPSMRVVHPPRPIGFWEQARRGKMIESEWRLHAKHPETRPPRWPLRWGPWVRMARRWQRRLFDPSVVRGSVRRAGRILALAAAQLAIGLHTTLTRWSHEAKRPAS